MPDDQSVAISPAQIEADARLVGWQPQAEYKGDPEKWKPAADFLQMAESQLPMARAQNRTLRETNSQLLLRMQQMQGQLTEFQGAIENLKSFHTEDTKRKVKEAREALVVQLKAARAAGDVDSEAEILDALTQGPKANGADTAAPTPAPPPREDPAWTAWKLDNPKFETDKKWRGVSVGIAEELRADPANAHLKGRAFFDEVGRQTDEWFAARAAPPRSDKSESGGNAGSGGGGGAMPKGKGYGQMPADAKAQCDLDGKKFIGKPGFKTADDWRSYYAKIYWESEA